MSIMNVTATAPKAVSTFSVWRVAPPFTPRAPRLGRGAFQIGASEPRKDVRRGRSLLAPGASLLVAAVVLAAVAGCRGKDADGLAAAPAAAP